ILNMANPTLAANAFISELTIRANLHSSFLTFFTPADRQIPARPNSFRHLRPSDRTEEMEELGGNVNQIKNSRNSDSEQRLFPRLISTMIQRDSVVRRRSTNQKSLGAGVTPASLTSANAVGTSDLEEDAMQITGLQQFLDILTVPDNVPIIAMLILVMFFTYVALKQARRNDQLIEHGHRERIIDEMRK
ncbi:MAG: hypothetical protein ACREQH_07710, partial [Candidatus Binatus sp.]